MRALLDQFHQRTEFEQRAWTDGFRAIAGVDEVGRGALAGPLVAAAVILPPVEDVLADAAFWCRVRDSKTVAHTRRCELAVGIRQRCPHVATYAVPCALLDAIGVGPANRMAMELAVRTLPVQPDLLLIDAMTIDHEAPQVGIIDGDARSVAIAAASIVAKVERDSFMTELDALHPGFGFAEHKGYGVAAHLEAIGTLGPCPQHRRSFAPVRVAWQLLHESR